MDGNNHYVRVDANNIVIHAFSDAFEPPLSTDKLVEENAGRHYNPVITDGQGNNIYKWNGTAMVDRTQDVDYALPITKKNKIAELMVAFGKTLAQGFTSTADGTTRTYGFSDADSRHWEWLRGTVLAGTCPNPVMVKDIASNRINLTPTQAGQLCTDAQNFYLTNYQHWDSKEHAAEQAIDIPTVNAIVW